MALPASGPVSMSMLRTELRNEGKSSNLELSKIGCLLEAFMNSGSGYVPINRSSTSKPNDDISPAQISEWYSYNHSSSLNCPVNINTPQLAATYMYYRVTVTGSSGASSDIVISSPDNFYSTMSCRIYSSYPFTNTGTLTGTPIFDGTFYNSVEQTYNYTLSSTSETLHFVFQDQGGGPPCDCFKILADSGTTTASYVDCRDISRSVIVQSGQTASICSRAIPTYAGGAAATIYACGYSCYSDIPCGTSC